jgi:hydrogenase maturation protease
MKSPVKTLPVTLADYNNSDSLIYGIGNIGRQDDGLGWAFIDWLEKESICHKADLMRHYQLQLEDADMISYKKHVLFVDASKVVTLKSFQLEKVKPKVDYSFTSHSLSVQTILATCRTCFDYVPDVHFLTIKGYEWELQQGLSCKAQDNLDMTINFFNKQT